MDPGVGRLRWYAPRLATDDDDANTPAFECTRISACFSRWARDVDIDGDGDTDCHFAIIADTGKCKPRWQWERAAAAAAAAVTDNAGVT